MARGARGVDNLRCKHHSGGMDLLTWIRDHGWSTGSDGRRIPTSLPQCAKAWGISYERLRSIANRRSRASYAVGKKIVEMTGGLVDIETLCGALPGQKTQRAQRTAPPPAPGSTPAPRPVAAAPAHAPAPTTPPAPRRVKRTAPPPAPVVMGVANGR
jgi:hypothetical protein